MREVNELLDCQVLGGDLQTFLLGIFLLLLFNFTNLII